MSITAPKRVGVRPGPVPAGQPAKYTALVYVGDGISTLDVDFASLADAEAWFRDRLDWTDFGYWPTFTREAHLMLYPWRGATDPVAAFYVGPRGGVRREVL